MYLVSIREIRCFKKEVCTAPGRLEVVAAEVVPIFKNELITAHSLMECADREGGMTENEWKFGKTGEQCQLCERGFAEGEAYFSALIQSQEQLQRRDFCADCFQSRRPADVYYYWKTSNVKADAHAKKARPV